MKKIFKITGVIALTLTLAFNIQYALLDYNVQNNPSLANAAWTNSSGTVFCGSVGNNVLAGTWVYHSPDAAHLPPYMYGYENGYYVFYPYNGGVQCGLRSGDETNIIPTGSGYQY